MSHSRSLDDVLQKLQEVDPYELEKIVAELWREEGYSATVRKGSGDRGVDVVAKREKPTPRKELIQVKRYSGSNKVGSKDVRLYATLYQQDQEADEIIIVTTNQATSAARQLADELSVTLIEGKKLSQMIQQSIINHLNWRQNKGDYSKSSNSKSYTPSSPWRISCPFCAKKIHNSEKGLIQHWANSSTCNFSKDEPKEIAIIDTDWESVTERVEQEREKTQQTSSTRRYSKCPFCTARIKHRDPKAYVEHWRRVCRRQPEDLPNQRPGSIPVDVWWDIKDLWNSEKDGRLQGHSNAPDTSEGEKNQANSKSPDTSELEKSQDHLDDSGPSNAAKEKNEADFRNDSSDSLFAKIYRFLT